MWTYVHVYMCTTITCVYMYTCTDVHMCTIHMCTTISCVYVTYVHNGGLVV